MRQKLRQEFYQKLEEMELPFKPHTLSSSRYPSLGESKSESRFQKLYLDSARRRERQSPTTVHEQETPAKKMTDRHETLYRMASEKQFKLQQLTLKVDSETGCTYKPNMRAK